MLVEQNSRDRNKSHDERKIPSAGSASCAVHNSKLKPVFLALIKNSVPDTNGTLLNHCITKHPL